MPVISSLDGSMSYIATLTNKTNSDIIPYTQSIRHHHPWAPEVTTKRGLQRILGMKSDLC
ncbi:hypothetical protein CRI94_16160 [Longibacter salinarum]|uniref:Uncharacterized protein n=1 Tax=Longibacter salinarum TaxID=1850348 RepID=A0A2A8CU45_9BACT|nr:hypothetical protein CRI94_16160 [Longibacter salinarum]